MCKEYALNSIRHNRAASISIAVTTVVATALLTLLASLFYNIWADDVANADYANSTIILIIYTTIFILAAISLILVIHNAFATVMQAKLRQLGLLQSVGATPKQIRSALLYETGLLCLPALLGGAALGFGLSYALMQVLIDIAAGIRDSELFFRFHPLVLVIGLGASLVTVYISAFIPAFRLSRITPLAALNSTEENALQKVRRYRLLTKVFGVEGELTAKSLYARRKSFRLAAIALLLSFLIFSAFLNGERLSALSTKETYFEHLPAAERAEALAKDQEIRSAYKLVVGGIAALLGVIGLANVFANALSSVVQRRREFARYLSLGLTPAGLWKMLALEAMLISLRPILIGLLINVVFVAWGLSAVRFPPSDYFANMPLVPILLFALAIILLVALAYYLGGRQILRQNTAEALRDDTLY